MHGVGLIDSGAEDLQTMLAGIEGLNVTWVKSPEELHVPLGRSQLLITSDSQFVASVAQMIQTASNFGWIQLVSSGFDALTRHGIPGGITVTNGRGISARTVAEHAMSFLLGLARQLPQIGAYQEEKRWDKPSLAETLGTLEDKNALVLGTGAIGQEVARKLRAFDVNVKGVNRSGHRDETGLFKQCYPVEELDQLLPTVDMVVICLPLLPSTRRLMDRTQFEHMREGSYLVNVGRGPIVGEEALVEALQRGNLAGCGLDVTPEEPPNRDSPLWECENVIISPHVAGDGGRWKEHFVELVADNLRRWKSGEQLRNVVEVGSKP